MWKTLGIVVVVVIAGIVALAARKPDTFTVERSVAVKAPPDKVFALINDFHRWDAWSPWEKIDPTMKRTFSGPDSGKGAGYAWQSDGKAGAGRMEITESTPPSKVVIKLDFLKPFETSNTVDFTLVPQGDATSVTWTMRGPSPFISKVMQVFVSMDEMIGKDFEAGLAAVKRAAEK
jgi:uncharacterized protein YndB with AHSA1/START domain